MRRNFVAVLLTGLMASCGNQTAEQMPTPAPNPAPQPTANAAAGVPANVVPPTAAQAPTIGSVTAPTVAPTPIAQSVASPAASAPEAVPPTASAQTGVTPVDSSSVAPVANPEAASASDSKLVLATQLDKVSYAIGRSIGQDLRNQEIQVVETALLRGIMDSVGGGQSLLTDDEVQKVLMEYQQEMQTKKAEKMKVAGDANKKIGDDFLAANKTKEGVQTLPSGLQYKVIQEGTGKTPTANSSVTTHYRGTLIDGTEFDSSYSRNQPATFPVSGVIAGWTEALQLMKEGAKWQLYIPSELAYGARGAGAKIGPNSVLIFDIELISVQ